MFVDLAHASLPFPLSFAVSPALSGRESYRDFSAESLQTWASNFIFRAPDQRSVHPKCKASPSNQFTDECCDRATIRSQHPSLDCDLLAGRNSLKRLVRFSRKPLSCVVVSSAIPWLRRAAIVGSTVQDTRMLHRLRQSASRPNSCGEGGLG